MNLRVVAVVILFLLGWVSALQGAIYHVSSSGSDGNSGTSVGASWRTLAKANGVVLAGDVVIVHQGEYSDGIHPRNSGQPGSPITYQVALGEHAVLITAIGVQLGSNHNHIVVDGFEVRASYRMAEVIGSSHITIRNSYFYGGRGNYSAFSLDGASYCVIQNNYLDRQDPDGSSQVGDEPTGGDGLRLIGASHHNLIEGNTATRCEHIAFASSFSKETEYQSYNIWRNNLSYKNHTNFSLQDGVQRCLFENNTGYYPGLVWTGGNGWCLQFTGTNCIIRFNTLYDDTSTVYISRQWPGVVGTMTGSANGSRPSMQYNKVYNNTVYGETDQREWQKEGWRFDNHDSVLVQNDNVLKNNIIAGSPYVQVDDIDVHNSFGSMKNRYEGNLLSGASGQPALVRYESSTEIGRWSLTDIKRLKPDQWASSNMEGDPLFVNTTGQGPAKDFSLRPGSPAIDAGVHLTVAANAGSGTVLEVEDAGYFCDGWGIPGVHGDSIKIEGQDPVGINGVDYGTNTLTLDGSRNWAKGARVFYYRSDRFQGSGPDIGAHELGGVVSPPPPPPARPSIPALISPANGVGNLGSAVTLRWGVVGSSVSYRVQVSRDAGFAASDFDVVTTDPFLVLSSLGRAVTYYWRVNATNATGTSDWSAAWSLTTQDPGNPPANLLSNAGFDEGLAAWSSYSNGQAEFSNSTPGYSGNYNGKIRIITTGDNTQVFQYNIPLEPNKTYTLSFVAYSPSGHDLDVTIAKHSPPYTVYGLSGARFDLTTSWKVYTAEFTTTSILSPVDDARLRFSFAPYAAAGDEYYLDDVVLTSVRPSLQAPALVAPPSGATSQSSDITLRWQQMPGVASYALEVALDSAFGVKVVSDSTIADTLYHLSSLQNGTSYYWHVRAASRADKSPFSRTYMFTMGQRALSVPAFTQLPLQSGFMPVEFTIAWSRVPGATGYQLQLATDSLYQSLDINDSTVTDTVRRIGPLRSGTMYYIRLRALRPGELGPFSPSIQFTASIAELSVPSLFPLPGRIDQQPLTVTMAWRPSEGATYYHLQLSADSLFSALVLNDSTVTDTVKLLGPLRDGSTYYFRLRAGNSISKGRFSAPLVFTTNSAQLPVPSIVALPGPSANLPVLTSIRWSAAPGAERYHLQLALDPQFMQLIVNDSTVTDTLAQVGPLAHGTTYFAHVRALNGVRKSAYSLPYSFTTIVAAPAAPVGIGLPAQPQRTSVVLTWPPVARALLYHLHLSSDSLFSTLLLNDSTLTDTLRTIESLSPSTRYFARVRARGMGGLSEFCPPLAFVTAGSSPVSDVPRDYLLEQNYPNPFNPSTKIRYGIPSSVHVRIVLFDVLGRQVMTLVDTDQAPGRYEIEFASSHLASGTYFYVLRAGSYVQTMKLMVVK